MRLTPPRRASLRMAGLVMPWMLSLQPGGLGQLVVSVRGCRAL